MWRLCWGRPFCSYGLAIAFSDVYPKWLGWAAAVGVGWIVLGLLVAHSGFTQVPLTMLVSVLLSLWVVVLAVFLWREAGTTLIRKSL